MTICYARTKLDGLNNSSNFLRPPPDIVDGQEEYEVEQILSHRTFGCSRQLQYLVKWQGYLSSDNTWEPAENIHAEELIRDYKQRMLHLWVGEQKSSFQAILDKLQRQDWRCQWEQLWPVLQGRDWKQRLKDLWQKSTQRQRTQLIQWLRQKGSGKTTLSAPVYPHEISPHYWDDTAPTV